MSDIAFRRWLIIDAELEHFFFVSRLYVLLVSHFRKLKGEVRLEDRIKLDLE